MMRLLVLHGPNLSQFGTRDEAHYGTATEADLVAAVREEVAAREAGTDTDVGRKGSRGVDVELFTSDHEGDLVGRIHAARTDGTAAVLINPGALTHYSWSLRDALDLLDCPVVEVHMSQTHAREPFRRHSVVSPVADVTITGAGILGYRLGARAALSLVDERQP